jgi:hypothetical protein
MLLSSFFSLRLSSIVLMLASGAVSPLVYGVARRGGERE